MDGGCRTLVFVKVAGNGKDVVEVPVDTFIMWTGVAVVSYSNCVAKERAITSVAFVVCFGVTFLLTVSVLRLFA